MPPAALMTWESNRAAVKLRRTGTLSGTRNEDRGWGEQYLDNAPTRSSSEAPRVATAGAATLAARAVRAQQKAMPVIGISVPGVRSGAATCYIA